MMETVARPTQLGAPSRAIQEQLFETDDTFRVYVKEWVLVFTEGQWIEGQEVETTAEEHFDAKYRGRVAGEDWKVGRNLLGLGCLELRLWNLRAETKLLETAEVFAGSWRDNHSPHCEIVGRGTRDEQNLREYGKRLLR